MTESVVFGRVSDSHDVILLEGLLWLEPTGGDTLAGSLILHFFSSSVNT